MFLCCCWYHKGTNFQANHNENYKSVNWELVVADTTKVRIFKQITTYECVISIYICCCWYHKGTNFQANHNTLIEFELNVFVVADTTKVRIFKQITTQTNNHQYNFLLLLIPQRYEFSSKSQQNNGRNVHCWSCCWYHKGTNFQANHNLDQYLHHLYYVVADTTKVRIFKQITTQI